MKIISLWSGPRNVSTALMYSFGQREDMVVIDEPLYAHYLANSDADHVGRKEVMDAMENDGHIVMQAILKGQSGKMIFLKNMAHHFIGLKKDYLNHMHNIFLIRDPEEMLPSLSQQLPKPTLRDTALKSQLDLHRYLEKEGLPSAIVDSNDLLLNPTMMLKSICKELEIPFDQKMLHWDAGPRAEDGIWAKYWYHNVHKSTGFAPYQKKEAPFPEHLKPLLKECIPYYKVLANKALKPQL